VLDVIVGHLDDEARAEADEGEGEWSPL
jgi:hypothetical protein